MSLGPAKRLLPISGSTVTIEPGKRGGKPCIRGLRITVYDVLDYLASGMRGRATGYTADMNRRGFRHRIDDVAGAPEPPGRALGQLGGPRLKRFRSPKRSARKLDRRLDDLEVEGPVGIPWEEVLSRIRSRRR